MVEPILHEVGLRDGLQAQKKVVPKDKKVAWAEALLSAGIPFLQVGSFVRPDRVPAMADTDEVVRCLKEKGYEGLSGLVFNEKGLERALQAGVDWVCMGVSASPTHSLKNFGKTPEEMLKRIIPLAKKAMEAGKTVQVSIQSAFGCGYEGIIPEERVYAIVDAYVEGGLTLISLADTAGHAYPSQVKSLITTFREKYPTVTFACHFHNTYGLGLANCFSALEAGVTYFEAAFGGLGGCPFTRISAGNVATEDLVHSFQREGYWKGLNLNKILQVAREAEACFEIPLLSAILKVGPLTYAS